MSRVNIRKYAKSIALVDTDDIDELVALGPVGERAVLLAINNVALDQSNLHPNARLDFDALAASRFAPMPLDAVITVANGVDITAGAWQWEWRNPEAGQPGYVGVVNLTSLTVAANGNSVVGGYVRLRLLERGDTGSGDLTNFTCTPASVNVPVESAPGDVEVRPGDTIRVCADTMAAGAEFTPASVQLNFESPHSGGHTPTRRRAR